LPSVNRIRGPSSRPAETVGPLAKKLGMDVNTNYALGNEAELVKDRTDFRMEKEAVPA
jgi:hypothetical protein